MSRLSCTIISRVIKGSVCAYSGAKLVGEATMSDESVESAWPRKLTCRGWLASNSDAASCAAFGARGHVRGHKI